MTAAIFHGIPAAAEITEFQHCTAAFVRKCHSKREVECHTKVKQLVKMRMLRK
jgi:hypothetical protein